MSGSELPRITIKHVQDARVGSLLRYTTGAWLYDQYDEGHTIRFIVIPRTASDGFMIVVNAPVADFDAAAAALDVVLTTVQFIARTASPSS